METITYIGTKKQIKKLKALIRENIPLWDLSEYPDLVVPDRDYSIKDVSALSQRELPNQKEK